MLLYSQMLISIYFTKSLLDFRDFFFKSKEESYLLLYAYLVDSFLSIVLIRNNLNLIIKISRNYRIRIIIEANFNSYYHAFATNIIDLIIR